MEKLEALARLNISTEYQRQSDLKKYVSFFGFFSDDVQNFLDKFRTFGVVPFRPVVSGSVVAEFHVAGVENLS